MIVTPPLFGLLVDLTGGYRISFAALALLAVIAFGFARLASGPAPRPSLAPREA